MIRPTKKQKVLLDYIATFIAEHGYSPSYREIKSALSYSSVSTVAHHINELIKRGYLQKRSKSARSLEVVGADELSPSFNQQAPAGHKWLIDAIDAQFQFVENNPARTQKHIDQLYVLVGALKVLGLDGAFTAFNSRLQTFTTQEN